tara:strand:- start:361 stop:846 length:486 start_codon:yes stop_codon:yes gene_type:complete
MEVTIANRRLKMIDGEIRIRAICRGKETKKEIWKPIKFCISRGYDKCNISIDGTKRIFKKHRLMYKLHNPDWDILDSSRDNHIDHINGIPLDNRIENLRVVTHQENHFNETKAKGYYLRPNGRYQACIRIDNKLIALGTYDTEQQAHQAYINAKLIYHIIL